MTQIEYDQQERILKQLKRANDYKRAEYMLNNGIDLDVEVKRLNQLKK